MPPRPRLLVEQAIDEAMDDLAQRNEARARQEAAREGIPRDRYARIGLALAVPVLVGLIVWNVTSAPVVAARMVGPVISRQEAEAALKAVVDDIEAFVEDYGEVPSTLAEIGLPAAGEWKYTPVANDRYRVEMTLGGQSLAFAK